MSRIGPFRTAVRACVADLVERLDGDLYSPNKFREALEIAMGGEAPPRSYARRLWCQELRRLGVSIRAIPDRRQLHLPRLAG